MRSRNFLTPFVEDNKGKVPMDVATSLVGNHVNLGVLCLFMLCLYLCSWKSYRSKIRHKKGLDYSRHFMHECESL